MFKIKKVMLRPPLTNVVHRVTMPPAARINERMICQHPEGIVVFFGVEDTDPQADVEAVRYMMVFPTGVQVGSPIPGGLDYLTSLVGVRMEVGGKLLVPGQPQQPRMVVEELHVFEFRPDNAAQVESLGKREEEHAGAKN